MATKFILKRKVFAEGEYPEERKKSSFGKKLAITAGVAGTLAGGFALAKNGKLGTTLQTGANQAWGNLGVGMSRLGFKNQGEKMISSGVKGISLAAGKEAGNRALAHNNLVTAAKEKGIELAKNTVGLNQTKGNSLFTDQEIQNRVTSAGANAGLRALTKFREKLPTVTPSA